MTEQTQCNKQILLVALDIAKKKHDALILFPSGKRLSTTVANSLEGYQLLLQRCQPDQFQIQVGFEPTADYHRNIAHWLATHGCQCFLISSLSSARAREMLFNTWDKNDRKDASVILYLMQQGLLQPFHDPLLAGVMDIQEISNTYHQISLARTRCMNSLFNHYITLYFPEMEHYFNSSRSEWFCRFLLKFPTPASITRYRCQTFVKRAWDVVGRKVSKQSKLEEIYTLAQQSVGLPVALDSVAVQTFKLQITRFLELTQLRKKLEQQADSFLSSRSDYHRLRSIPGIGPIIALIILAETGDLTRFSHYRQFLAFCGFNLSAQQSGSKRGAYRLSKRGNSRLRYAFWLAATVAISMKENAFRQKFVRYVQRDPTDADLCRKARVAVAAKMARVAHAVVKQNVNYIGFYEVSHGT